MIKILFDPDRFFRERSDDISLTTSAVVVLAAALTSTLGTILVMLEVRQSVSGSAGSFISIGFGIGIVGAFLAMFFSWIAFTAVFHAISGWYGGEGEFRDTMRFTAWGFTPKIFAGLLSGVATYYTLLGVRVPDDPAKMAAFAQQIQASPSLRVASAVGIVFTLWSLFIWTLAIKHARGIELRQAAISVAAPVLVSIAWTIYNLL